ncbi:MAG: DUF6092 family protein [Bacillota bacterium]
MKAETKQELGQLLCYMASSARGLLDEPASYGPFRLIDAVSRLIGSLETEGVSDPELARIRTLIDEQKYLVMTDIHTFTEMLDAVVIELATWLDGK